MNNNTTIAPKSIVLVCNITAREVKWTNRAIIQKHINKHGSLEAFLSAYVSKGAGKVSTSMKEDRAQRAASFGKKAKIVRPLLEQGVALGKLSPTEYTAQYTTRTITYKDGVKCTVVAPKVN